MSERYYHRATSRSSIVCFYLSSHLHVVLQYSIVLVLDEFGNVINVY